MSSSKNTNGGDIGPGDLIYVAQDCCGAYRNMFGVVDAVRFGTDAILFRFVLSCEYCGAAVPVKWVVHVNNNRFQFPLPWVRKVPPDEVPTEEERVKHLVV